MYHCLALFSSFVCLLYSVVPASVRRLPRDDASHIRWRAAIVVGVAMTGAGAYPWLFCQKIAFADEADAYDPGNVESPSPPLVCITRVFLAADAGYQDHPPRAMPYLGTLTCLWLRIYHHCRILRREEEEEGVDRDCEGEVIKARRLPISPGPKHLLRSLDVAWIRPTV